MSNMNTESGSIRMDRLRENEPAVTQLYRVETAPFCFSASSKSSLKATSVTKKDNPTVAQPNIPTRSRDIRFPYQLSMVKPAIGANKMIQQ